MIRLRAACGLWVVAAAFGAACSSSTSSGGFGPDGGAGGGDAASLSNHDGSTLGDGGGVGHHDGAPSSGTGSSKTDGAASPPDTGSSPSPDGGGGMTTPDSGGPPADAGVDSGPTPDENQWLIPMNNARSLVGEHPLTWNATAAQVAATYAAMCDYAHNPSASSQYMALGGSGDLGENIAAGAPSETPDAAVGSWVAEKAHYDHATNSCGSGDDCSHYTQIVWSTTTSVGCAHVSCTMNTPFGQSFPDWDFSVCDYAPPGNYVGESPY